MNENIKEIVNIIGNAELSNKCHSDCFINTDFDNECSLCRQATALVKAGYRKQSKTVKEFVERLIKRLTKEVKDNPEAAASQYKAGLYFAMDLAEQYGKEEK